MKGRKGEWEKGRTGDSGFKIKDKSKKIKGTFRSVK
jgi:hypothetical protein